MTVTENSLNNEENLLLNLCRLELFVQKEKVTELIKKVTDWKYFTDLANGHGVIALCWYNITALGFDMHVPEDYLKTLHSGFYKTLTRNIFLRDLFDEIAGLAGKEKMKVVGLKGIALEQMVYGGRGLRQMSDIDILVELKNGILLRKILLKNGFTSVPLISPLHQGILPYLKAHLPPMEKKGGIAEIHVKLFDEKDNYLTEEFFANSVKADDNKENIYWPKPLHFFLYLVKHIVNHENTKDLKIKSYLDIAVLLSVFGDQIFNEHLFESAGKVNLAAAIREKLGIMKIFWNFSFPENIEREIQKLDLKKISEQFIWLIKNPVQPDPESKIESLSIHFRSIPGSLNKVLFAVGYLFPSPGYMKYHFKTSSSIKAIIYYPVRWWRLLRLAAGKRGLKV